MRSQDYGPDVLSGRKRRAVPEVPAQPGLVVEDPESGYCGAVVRMERDGVVLEDRHARLRVFPLRPAGFLVDGVPVTLTRPPVTPDRAPGRSASGSRRVEEFGPARERRLGVLVDHLVAGSKESRIVAAVTDPDVLVTGHPYVDIWQAVKPASLGIREWPIIPKGQSWKDGICAALGWGDPMEGWRRVLAGVRTFRDLETPLVGAVERLIDFVTEPAE